MKGTTHEGHSRVYRGGRAGRRAGSGQRALGASASTDIGSQICGFGGPAAASTAYVNATSVHYHQANGVAWGSQTFGSGFHRFSYGNGVVTMQISYPSGTETGHAFSCANGSF